MSTVRAGRKAVAGLGLGQSLARYATLLAAGGLVASFVVVLYDVVQTVGETTTFTLVVIGTLLAATALAGVLSARRGLAVAFVALVAGLGYHGVALGLGIQIIGLLQSTSTLLTGRSILWIPKVELWALGLVPGPTFAVWFLALRRRYSLATLTGGLMLVFFVLTGDAGTGLTVLGVVSGAALVGFGDIDRKDGRRAATEYIAVVLALMVLTPFLVTIVPGGQGTPLRFNGGQTTTPTMEQNVVEAGTTLEIRGTVAQTPEVRFIVESEEPRYWRTGSYDRYTGNGWIRTVDESKYSGGKLPEPPGTTRTIRQEFELKKPMGAAPAAWRPAEIDSSYDDLLVTESGGLQVDGTLDANTSYEVTSEVPNPLTPVLVNAGTNYPTWVADTYTQLPERTPDRVGERTQRILGDVDNPYESALRIEDWLRTNRQYSLDVDRPDGSIVDSFLFEMEAGYCTYHATTMVGMLRSVDIPARLAVGYTPGEPVGDDRWVVRGVDSHAWVEVYFPDVGWVEFDPTPPDPRSDAEQVAIDRGRQEGDVQVDVDIDDEQAGDTRSNGTLSSDRPTIDQYPSPGNETPDGQLSPENETSSVPEESPESETIEDPRFHREMETALEASENETPSVQEPPDEGDPLIPAIPRLQLALGAIVLAGMAAGVRRTGVGGHLRREFAIRFQQRSDPATDIERAYDRLCALLAKRHRSRETGETMRQYLDAVDAGEQARRIAEIRERKRYEETVSQALADEAVELVDELRRG